MEQLLNDPEILSRHVRAIARPNSFEGVGCCEAPRGTLIHHYKIDEQGLIRWANLIIATGHQQHGDESRNSAGRKTLCPWGASHDRACSVG